MAGEYGEWFKQFEDAAQTGGGSFDETVGGQYQVPVGGGTVPTYRDPVTGDWRNTPPSTTGSGDSSWVTQALQAVQSTDDPNYWIQQITAHGDINNPAARDYWIDRINRGDGSILVRTGQLSRVSDGGSTGGSQGPTSGISSMISPGELMAPWEQQFQAPDPTKLNENPVYQYRINQAMQGIQRGAAARGNLLTGGLQNRLGQAISEAASNEYDKIYGRAQNEYSQAYNIFENNQAKKYNRLASIAGVGQTAAGSLGSFGSGYANQASSLYGDMGNANAANSAAQGQIWGNFFNNAGNQIQTNQYLRDYYGA